jgi:hypothetical protein
LTYCAAHVRLGRGDNRIVSRTSDQVAQRPRALADARWGCQRWPEAHLDLAATRFVAVTQVIRRACPVRYDRPADSGRTQPFRVAVETLDGEALEVFLKPSGAPELDVEGLCCEALAACLAGHLGVPVCEPLLVDLDEEWVSSVTDGRVRAILKNSNPTAFGSVSAGDGWHLWLPSDKVTADRRDTARAIFAFDALIENPDRGRIENPNLLVKNASFRVIDHELALRVRLLIPKPQPWAIGGLARLSQPGGHILASHLKGTTALDLAPVREAWSTLSDEMLADFEASIPEQWAEATNAVASALTHVGNVRDRIDDCMAEIERVLR